MDHISRTTNRGNECHNYLLRQWRPKINHIKKKTLAKNIICIYTAGRVRTEISCSPWYDDYDWSLKHWYKGVRSWLSYRYQNHEREKIISEHSWKTREEKMRKFVPKDRYKPTTILNIIRYISELILAWKLLTWAGGTVSCMEKLRQRVLLICQVATQRTWRLFHTEVQYSDFSKLDLSYGKIENYAKRSIFLKSNIPVSLYCSMVKLDSSEL